MSVSKQNLISGFTGAAMAISAALSPTAITAQEISGTQDNVQMASLEATPVILRYGENVFDVDLLANNMASLGIPVIVESGYPNPECGLAIIGETSIGFDQNDVDGGDLGLFILTTASGEEASHYLPSCDGQA